MPIFRVKINAFVAQVADLGYATQSQGEVYQIKIPKSPLWSAPEYHWGAFSRTEAKKNGRILFRSALPLASSRSVRPATTCSIEVTEGMPIHQLW